jgi:hypothetical protein
MRKGQAKDAQNRQSLADQFEQLVA